MMRLRVFFTSLACVAGLAACAPDSIQSYRAGGLNDFLDTVQAQCQPLWIGPMLLDRPSAPPGHDSLYTIWLDLTSRLYYQRISAADYREGVIASTDSGDRTTRSVDCIIAKLPAARPTAPGGAPIAR
jgi:hypothetical protein